MRFLFSLVLAFYSTISCTQIDFQIMVLGTAQDGGFPQAECKKSCCKESWLHSKKSRMISCIALVDIHEKTAYIFDASPDLPHQLHMLYNTFPSVKLGAVFLTHAHIGHYTGLMHFGREVQGAKEIKVYTMPRMKDFLTNNGPWSQLVSLKNISLQDLSDTMPTILSSKIKINTFVVPHRDEYSETVGFQIILPHKKIIYLPDIDKWQKWNKPLVELVKENDLLFLDGTFFRDGEINRPMSEVPHPFVTETIHMLDTISTSEKQKIYFIHLNHTNPLLQKKSIEYKTLLKSGFHIAEQGAILN